MFDKGGGASKLAASDPKENTPLTRKHMLSRRTNAAKSKNKTPRPIGISLHAAGRRLFDAKQLSRAAPKRIEHEHTHCATTTAEATANTNHKA